MNTENGLKIHNIRMDFLEAIFVLVIIANMLMMMLWVSSLQGTARVVNYTGIIRGATQRLVKLELMKQQNIDLEHRLDGILLDLNSKEPGVNNLILLPDDDYKNCLSNLTDAWIVLREKLEMLRTDETLTDEVLKLSEKYFILADNTVSAAEIYSERLASRIQSVEIATCIFIIFEIILIIYKSISNFKIMRKMKELDKLAYIDLHTCLPNKSRCMQFLNNTSIAPPHTVVYMFDLNFLKQVNDELGHEAGDSLIKNFATLLRNNISPKHFVGRFGGDEFIVIANDTSMEEAAEIEKKLLEAEKDFNETSRRGYTLSFSYGYASSDEFVDCTYKILFDKADHNMYEYKKELKKQFANGSLR